MQSPDAPPRHDELGRAARGGAITFVGAACGSGLSFLLTVLFARELGGAGTGVVLQAIAAFTIALSVALLGMDTTAVWLLPRLLATQPAKVRAAVVTVTVVPLATASGLVATWLLVRRAFPPSSHRDALYDAITTVALFIPAAAVMGVAIAITRAFGGVLPFTLVDRVLVPGLRIPGLLLAVSLGGGTTAVALSWGAPWAIGLAAALGVMTAQLRRRTQGGEQTRADWPLVRRVFRFALPRTVASVLEQTLVWVNVLLVGAVAGAAAAGVYGSAARFVAAGLIVASALRIVVAPRFSALLAEGELEQLEQLFSVTARWILLFGSPIYLSLAIFSPTVLGWLGPDFEEGVGTMVVLCLASIFLLAAGNTQSLLLMSGKSGLAAVNKAGVVALNVIGTLVMVPRVGIVGAAWVWAVGLVVDTALATYQVRRATGVTLSLRSVSQVAVMVALCVGAPATTVVLLLGQGTAQLLLAVTVGGILLLTYCYADRRRLRLDELRFRSEPRGGGVSVTSHADNESAQG